MQILVKSEPVDDESRLDSNERHYRNSVTGPLIGNEGLSSHLVTIVTFANSQQVLTSIKAIHIRIGMVKDQ